MHGTQRSIRRKLISLLIMELMIMSPAMAYEPQVPVDPSKVPYDLLIMGDSIWRNDIGGIGSLAGKIHTALGGRATGIVASAEIVGVGPCRIIDTTIAYMNINVVPFQAKVFSFTPGIDQVTGYCGKSKEESLEKYIVDLRKLIAEYKRLQPKGVFVYGLSPRCDECALKYGVCERRDIDVRNLNHAVRQLGPELGFPSIDIHSMGVRYNIPTTDGRHFNDAGALPQSKHLESVLSRYLPYSGTDEAPWVYLTSPDEIVYP